VGNVLPLLQQLAGAALAAVAAAPTAAAVTAAVVTAVAVAAAGLILAQSNPRVSLLDLWMKHEARMIAQEDIKCSDLLLTQELSGLVANCLTLCK
jgi:Na+-transporting NADH:ubiquinone oxidoreductase subunit NqrD